MQTRVPPRSPPCSFFGECILQAAIDFAALRKRNAARSSAWQALHLTLTFSRLLVRQPRISPRSPLCKFLAAFSASAFCKVQLILRSCLSSQGKAWQALRLSLTFSRLLVYQPRFSPRNPPCSFFYKCILRGAIDFAVLRSEANGGAECRTFFGVACFAPKPNF
jgi:hypothetical protein